MSMPVPIIAVNGFLESGKTFFLNEAIDQETFIDSVARCVLVLCEQGEEEYDPAVMRANHVNVVEVSSPAELTEEFYRGIVRKYRPDLIYIEQNVMWGNYEYPPCVELAQQLTVIDAATFQIYFNNMRQRVVDMLRLTEAVIMYNCDDESAVTAIKRSLQLINPKMGFLLFNSFGDTISLADDLPYSVETDYINVADEDYGIFYVDSYENHARYNGKTVEITIKAVLDDTIPEGFFVGGRRVMTCCADDISFLGVVCYNNTSCRIQNGDWLRAVGEVSYKLVDNEPHMLFTVISCKKLTGRSDDETIGIQ
ncbi:MAG: hypothetical protein IJX70_01490 [Clostridia bacterium]|nr:hypothetical protein [Clostridia bacterium]